MNVNWVKLDVNPILAKLPGGKRGGGSLSMPGLVLLDYGGASRHVGVSVWVSTIVGPDSNNNLWRRSNRLEDDRSCYVLEGVAGGCVRLVPLCP